MKALKLAFYRNLSKFCQEVEVLPPDSSTFTSSGTIKFMAAMPLAI